MEKNDTIENLSYGLKGKKENSVFWIAMRDISDYLRSQNFKIIDENRDVWVVTPSRMANKETTKLNEELGLHKVNKFGERMARYKYH